MILNVLREKLLGQSLLFKFSILRPNFQIKALRKLAKLDDFFFVCIVLPGTDSFLN